MYIVNRHIYLLRIEKFISRHIVIATIASSHSRTQEFLPGLGIYATYYKLQSK